MDSLNVPLPAAVRREIEALRPALSSFETIREEPTLVLKRFDGSSAAAIESEARLALAATEPFEARLDGLDVFQEPVSGPAPVVYLAVDSPGLEQLHTRLVDAFGTVDGLEGVNYIPHVTIARGGEDEVLEPLQSISVDPVAWTVTELWFWDARGGGRTGRVGLTS